MKSQVLHTVRCYISDEAGLGNLKLIPFGSERVKWSLRTHRLDTRLLGCRDATALFPRMRFWNWKKWPRRQLSLIDVHLSGWKVLWWSSRRNAETMHLQCCSQSKTTRHNEKNANCWSNCCFLVGNQYYTTKLQVNFEAVFIVGCYIKSTHHVRAQ